MVLVAVFLEDPSEWVAIDLDDKPVKIGRQPEVDHNRGEVEFRIPWRDRLINRNHSVAERKGQDLLLKRLPPLPSRGEPNRFYTNAPHEEREVLKDPLRIRPGHSFSIGARGRTAFFWLNSVDELREAMQQQRPFGGLPQPQNGGSVTPRPSLQYDEVEGLDDYSLRLQLKLLQRELPEKVLSGWTDENELLTKAADFLKTALPGQRGVSAAFIALEDESTRTFEILNQDPSARADFRVSGTLLGNIDLSAATSSDTYLWSSENKDRPLADSSVLGRVDWVAILPVASMDEAARIYRDRRKRPVFLYVEVRQATSASATAFVPFLRLIVSLVASLLASREQQRIQDQLSEHFSPALRRILQAGDAERLKPTLADCTVLFCDRRSSSEIMEMASSDEEVLMQLRENQAIVGEISEMVFENEGVITDFAGDGVLALWGWPMGGTDHALQAVKTAEAIARRLAAKVETTEDGHGLAAVRMGISTGRIAVGDTGPVQQVHISVFGRVVNFGARLEALGKQFHVPALLSEETAEVIRDGGRLVRRLCYVRPAGFKGSYPIYELVLSRDVGGSGATKKDIETYERALGHFVEREWSRCQELLSQLPDHDEPAHWLSYQADVLRAYGVGDDWQGEISSLSK